MFCSAFYNMSLRTVVTAPPSSTQQPLQIKSVVAPDHVKGYIYVESYKQTHVKSAIEGIGNLRMGLWNQQMVPIKEMTDVLKVVKEVTNLKSKSWVRLKRGLYKDDIAQVPADDTKHLLHFLESLFQKQNQMDYQMSFNISTAGDTEAFVTLLVKYNNNHVFKAEQLLISKLNQTENKLSDVVASQICHLSAFYIIYIFWINVEYFHVKCFVLPNSKIFSLFSLIVPRLN